MLSVTLTVVCLQPLESFLQGPFEALRQIFFERSRKLFGLLHISRVQLDARSVRLKSGSLGQLEGSLERNERTPKLLHSFAHLHMKEERTARSYLQKGERLRPTQLALESLFGFADLADVCSEFLAENGEFDLAELQLALHDEQSVLLLLSQQVPDLLVLGGYGFLRAFGRLLQGSMRRTSLQGGCSLDLSPHCCLQMLSLLSGTLVICSCR